MSKIRHKISGHFVRAESSPFAANVHSCERTRGTGNAGLHLASIHEVRRSQPCEVRTFRDLVGLAGDLCSANFEFNILFRGQAKEDLDRDGKTRLYPSMYRPHKGGAVVRKKRIANRYDVLRQVVHLLRNNPDFRPKRRPLLRHHVVFSALLQHYKICPTPFLDLTQSLRVAATFALLRQDSGILYAVAVPYPHSALTFSVTDELMLARLTSIAPSNALRPHFQEGYLVGRWPSTREKQAEDNIAHRLLGKYRLNNDGGSFWSDEFPAVPTDALLPETDDFRDQLLEALRNDKALFDSINCLRTSEGDDELV